MTTPGFTDKHGQPLKIGQHVRVQVSTGPYGETAIREGEIIKLFPNLGATIKTSKAFSENCGRFGMQYHKIGDLVWVILPRTGYERFRDFEHGHETWTEIVKG